MLTFFMWIVSIREDFDEVISVLATARPTEDTKNTLPCLSFSTRGWECHLQRRTRKPRAFMPGMNGAALMVFDGLLAQDMIVFDLPINLWKARAPMKRTKTATFLIELPLQVDEVQAARLRAHLEAGRCLYNALLGEALKRLDKMRRDPGWQAARAIPRTRPQERGAAFSHLRQ